MKEAKLIFADESKDCITVTDSTDPEKVLTQEFNGHKPINVAWVISAAAVNTKDTRLVYIYNPKNKAKYAATYLPKLNAVMGLLDSRRFYHNIYFPTQEGHNYLSDDVQALAFPVKHSHDDVYRLVIEIDDMGVL